MRLLCFDGIALTETIRGAKVIGNEDSGNQSVCSTMFKFVKIDDKHL